MVRHKRHGTACAIGPKGEARTLGPCAPSVPKAKLGHSVCVHHRVLIFRKLYTWVRFNNPPWLGPKDTELRVPLVPKAKLGHRKCVCPLSQRQSWNTQTACAIGPKGKDRAFKPHAPLGPYIQEVIYMAWV